MQSRGGGEKLTLALAEALSPNHHVYIFHDSPLDVPELERYFGVDLGRVKFVPLDPPGLLLRVMMKVRGPRPPTFSLHHYLQIGKFKLDLFFNVSYASGLACPAARGIFVCMFPADPASRRSTAGLFGRARDSFVNHIERSLTGFGAEQVLDSYATVVSISRFTAKWVSELWGRDAEIVYPPCDVVGADAAKQKMILHVGRFSAPHPEPERHEKGQPILLEAFKQMSDLHQSGWELHFAGSVGPDQESARFAASVVECARGFPVKFHFNAGLEELRELYRQTSIYWHATGLGFDAETYPAKQEHFGIATVTAMSAGAVPVVYGTGAQREIVTHGIDGFCWDNVNELMQHTREVVNDSDLRARLAPAAFQTSAKFAPEIFAKRMDLLVRRVLADRKTSKDPCSNIAESPQA